MKEALCQLGLFLREKETRHGKWSLRVSIGENGFVYSETRWEEGMNV
jgi:hypothetical protein